MLVSLMDCIVRIIRGQIATQDIRVKAPSAAAAKALVKRAVRKHAAGDWELQTESYDYECDEH